MEQSDEIAREHIRNQIAISTDIILSMLTENVEAIMAAMTEQVIKKLKSVPDKILARDRMNAETESLRRSEDQ